MSNDYSLTRLTEMLGRDATTEDAEAALERAENWYNATPKGAVLAWYESYRENNPNVADIRDEDDPGTLVDDWNEAVMFHRAASLEDLA